MSHLQRCLIALALACGAHELSAQGGYPVPPSPLADAEEIAAMSYMMSPKQVLFSDASSSGRRGGPWSPHLMINMPHLTPAQLGRDSTANVDVLQVDHPGQADAQLIVKVPQWSDGSSAR